MLLLAGVETHLLFHSAINQHAAVDLLSDISLAFLLYSACFFSLLFFQSSQNMS